MLFSGIGFEAVVHRGAWKEPSQMKGRIFLHIAIEGLDGAGKTTTARLLAKETGYLFLRNPIYDLVGEKGIECFEESLKQIDGDLQTNVATLFYGMGNLYLNRLKQGQNIITDRHLCATYLWNFNGSNIKAFDFLVDVCGKPDLTIILYAKANIRKERIIDRNPEDPDLKKDIFNDDKYDKALEFVRHYNMQYAYLDNSYMTIDETVKQINCIIETNKDDVGKNEK